MKNLILLMAICLNGCGVAHKSNKHGAAQPIREGDPIPADFAQALEVLETDLVDLANRSLDKKTFAQTKHWISKHPFKVKNTVETSATASANKFQIFTIERKHPNEFTLSFELEANVHDEYVRYHAKDELKASVSNADLPTNVYGELWIHWREDKQDDLEFLANEQERFLTDLLVEVQDFNYEDTFLKNIPASDRHDIRDKVRDTINEALEKRDDSMSNTLNTDINKLSTRKKFDLRSLLLRVESRVDNLHKRKDSESK